MPRSKCFGAFLRTGGAVDSPDLDLQALLTAAQAALYAGLVDADGKPKVNVIVNWRNRRLLPVAVDDQGREIRDWRGRPYYRLIDVIKADGKTRERSAVMAERLAARANAA
jgi:hypothetical protein